MLALTAMSSFSDAHETPDIPLIAANLNILDEEFAAQQVCQFETDKRRSRRITLDEYRRRPLKEKVMEHVAEWFRSQL